MRILSPAINLFFERLVRSQSLDQIADFHGCVRPEAGVALRCNRR